MYRVKLKFDVEGGSPTVYVVDSNGTCVLEVLEDPVPLTPEWSWCASDWQIGPFAQRILRLLNQ